MTSFLEICKNFWLLPPFLRIKRTFSFVYRLQFKILVPSLKKHSDATADEFQRCAIEV